MMCRKIWANSLRVNCQPAAPIMMRTNPSAVGGMRRVWSSVRPGSMKPNSARISATPKKESRLGDRLYIQANGAGYKFESKNSSSALLRESHFFIFIHTRALRLHKNKVRVALTRGLLVGRFVSQCKASPSRWRFGYMSMASAEKHVGQRQMDVQRFWRTSSSGISFSRNGHS